MVSAEWRKHKLRIPEDKIRREVLAGAALMITSITLIARKPSLR
jgi:hypothetical protein